MIRKILSYSITSILVLFIGYYVYIKMTAAATGDQAPNFKATLVDGTKFQLSDLKGQYVLLDFWGSWCGPCRRENPNLVQFYKEHKSEITIVSIALEKNNDNWKNAIARDGLEWKHHIVEVGNFVFTSGIAKDFGVSAIPTKILISPEGIILDADSFDEIAEIIAE
ncbi:MAG: thiol-disulfide isomerase/thioredoxin [Crocinitomicaceae bacterium]|jgi:thiol-disulfide isomerase/thioredoxin